MLEPNSWKSYTGNSQKDCTALCDDNVFCNETVLLW